MNVCDFSLRSGEFEFNPYCSIFTFFVSGINFGTWRKCVLRWNTRCLIFSENVESFECVSFETVVPRR